MVAPVPIDGFEPRAPREPGGPADGGAGGGDPTGGIPIPGRLPSGGQGDKLELLSGRLNQPVPLAYGLHVIGGNIILQHEVTDGADAGKTILIVAVGEGEFDKPLYVWVNGLIFDIFDTAKFHFHPGIDGQLGAETNPALPNQQLCSFFPESFNERFTFSRTAYIALKLSPDPTAPGPGFHVVGIYRTKRVRIFDASGNLLRFVYSANPAWVALDLLIRGWIKPFARNVAHAEIETAGNNGAVRAANVVTITTKTPHGFTIADTVRVDGVADASFNGNFPVSSVPSSTSFTYNQADVDATSGGGAAYDDDLLIAERAKIDFQAFADWATDCDALGFEAHLAFVDQTDLLRALELVLLSGRGYLLEVAGKATPFMDKARSSVLTLAKKDIVAGTFSLTQKDARSLANKLQVRFRSLASGRGPGTISTVGTAVTGAGTEFRNWFKANSVIQLDSGPEAGQAKVVVSVASDTSLTIGGAFTADQTAQLYSNPALDFQPSLKELEDIDHQDEIGRTISEEIDLVNTEPEDAERLGEWLLRTTLLLTDQMSCQLQIGQGSLDLLPGDLITAPSTFEFDPAKTKVWQVLEAADLGDGWREIVCQEHSDSVFVDTFGPQQRTAPAQPGDPLEFITTLEGQLSKGLSFGQLSDPFVIKTTVVPGAGSIASGNWEIAIDSLDSDGAHSFSQLVQVNVPSGTDNAIDVEIIPIWGGVGYHTFIGASGTFPSGTFFEHATDRPDGDIISAGKRIIRVTSTPGSGANPQGGTNATRGDLFANFVLNATIPGGPASFFLNLGQLENSQSAFFFSDYIGICASFQSKGTGGTAPAGGKTELDIAFNSDAVQLIVAPFDISKELDIFVNNTLVAIFFGFQFSVFQDLVMAEAAAIGPIGSRSITLRGLNASQVLKQVILLQNTSNEFEIDVDGVQQLLINSATSKFTILKHLHVGLDFQHLGTKLGFFNTAAVTKTAVAAGPGAFSGIDNAQAGAVYAQVADLNTLRLKVNEIRDALASYGAV